MKIILNVIFTLFVFSQMAFGQQKALEDYLPVLPEVKTDALNVDPNKGYLVKKLKPNVYLLTDGIWQSAFVTTGKGVVLLDAPESYGAHIQKAVAEVTAEPIRKLVYTHSHVDHIGGSHNLKEIKGLEIWALQSVADYLKEKDDPRPLLPTKTFGKKHALRFGTATIELENHGNYHSDEGNLSVYLPQSKFLMVIDVLAPGYVPFKGLDLSSNIHEYLQIFDRILAYDFNVFLGGHLTYPGVRKDVELTKEYVEDLHATVKRIHAETNPLQVMDEAAEEVGWDNKYLLFKVFLEDVVDRSAKEIESRWRNRLTGVDVWSQSHCEAMLVYVRWD